MSMWSAIVKRRRLPVTWFGNVLIKFDEDLYWVPFFFCLEQGPIVFPMIFVYSLELNIDFESSEIKLLM